MIVIHGILASSVAKGLVRRFMTATGITDPVIEGALEVFVDTLETNNLLSKFDAIYPFVGGTAFTNKFNLINPLDTNAAFRITFNGGWTHNSNGVTGNGINTFGNTWYDDGLYALDNDHHISIYNRTDNHIQYCEIGNYDGAKGSNIFTRNPIVEGNRSYFRNQGGINLFFTDTDARGWRCSNRVGNTEIRGAVNGSLRIIGEAFVGKVTGYPYYIGSLNNTGARQFTGNRNLSFASIGKGFTDAELIIVYNAIQTLQTALGRNV